MKKKILILTTKYPKEKNNLWLTNELALEFLKKRLFCTSDCTLMAFE